MLKTIVIAAFLTCGAIGAYGQTAPAQPKSPTAPAERTVSTGDFNVGGDMAASALIGAKVRNDNKETVGKIDDIYLDKDGNIKTVVISVGGFLGVGSKAVAVKWSDIKFGRDDTSGGADDGAHQGRSDSNAGLYQGRASSVRPGRNRQRPAGPASPPRSGR